MGEVLPPLCLMMYYPQGVGPDPALEAASLDSKGDREKRSESSRGGWRVVPGLPISGGAEWPRSWPLRSGAHGQAPCLLGFFLLTTITVQVERTRWE